MLLLATSSLTLEVSSEIAEIVSLVQVAEHLVCSASPALYRVLYLLSIIYCNAHCSAGCV